jgi:hypothetical protein
VSRPTFFLSNENFIKSKNTKFEKLPDSMKN